MGAIPHLCASNLAVNCCSYSLQLSQLLLFLLLKTSDRRFLFLSLVACFFSADCFSFFSCLALWYAEWDCLTHPIIFFSLYPCPQLEWHQTQFSVPQSCLPSYSRQEFFVHRKPRFYETLLHHRLIAMLIN